MSRRALIVAIAVLVVAKFWVSTVFTGTEWQWLPLPSVRIIDSTLDWASSVDFDGNTSVWIEGETGTDGNVGLTRLAFKERTASATQYCDISSVDAGDEAPAEHGGWLVAGPYVHGDFAAYRIDNGSAIAGDIAYAVTLSDCTVRAVVDSRDWQTRESYASSMALHAGILYWADGRGPDFDIWGMALDSGASEMLVGGVGHQYQPAVSDGWIVWKHSDGSSSDADVRSQQLAGGETRTIGGVTEYHPLVVSEDRTAWFGSSLVEPGTLAIQVYDLADNRSGYLVQASWRHADMLAMSPDVLVRTIRVVGAGTSTEETELRAHDARAISSYVNLNNYLTGYYVTTTASDYVRPVAAGSVIQWTDSPVSEGEKGALIREALVPRSAAHLPHTSSH